jgi:hypothetical protein
LNCHTVLNRPRRFSLFFGPVRFTSAQLVLSRPFPFPDVASPPIDIVTRVVPCHASFPLSQDELVVSASSSSNALSCWLPSQTETKALNLHHRRRLPSSDRSTPILHCYKKIISILITLPTTQSRLHFASSLTRAPRHWSFTCRRHSFPPLSHAPRPFV